MKYQKNKTMMRVYSATIALRLIISALSLLWLALPMASANGTLSVYVVNYPLKYFVERIGGPHVKVTLPVPPDVDPVYWIPSIADISAYQQADLILLNGAGYAKWITKVSLPRSKTVDTSRSFKDRYLTVKEKMTHSHGPEGEHPMKDWHLLHGSICHLPKNKPKPCIRH